MRAVVPASGILPSKKTPTRLKQIRSPRKRRTSTPWLPAKGGAVGDSTSGTRGKVMNLKGTGHAALAIGLMMATVPDRGTV
jgi:hypothetical protein